MAEFICPECDCPMDCNGAMSHGYGDLADEWTCPLCGLSYEVHTNECPCWDCQTGVSPVHEAGRKEIAC